MVDTIPDEIWQNHIFIYKDDFLNLYLTNSLFNRLLQPYIIKNNKVKNDIHKYIQEGDILNIYLNKLNPMDINIDNKLRYLEDAYKLNNINIIKYLTFKEHVQYRTVSYLYACKYENLNLIKWHLMKGINKDFLETGIFYAYKYKNNKLINLFKYLRINYKYNKDRSNRNMIYGICTTNNIGLFKITFNNNKNIFRREHIIKCIMYSSNNGSRDILKYLLEKFHIQLCSDEYSLAYYISRDYLKFKYSNLDYSNSINGLLHKYANMCNIKIDTDIGRREYVDCRYPRPQFNTIIIDSIEFIFKIKQYELYIHPQYYKLNDNIFNTVKNIDIYNLKIADLPKYIIDNISNFLYESKSFINMDYVYNVNLIDLPDNIRNYILDNYSFDILRIY